MEKKYEQLRVSYANLHKEHTDFKSKADETRGKEQKEFNKKLEVLQRQIMELERTKKDESLKYNHHFKENLDILNG